MIPARRSVRRPRKNNSVVPDRSLGSRPSPFREPTAMELSPETQTRPKTEGVTETRESLLEKSPMSLQKESVELCEAQFAADVKKLADKRQVKELGVSDRHRVAIFDWAVEVLAVYRQNDGTLFRCVALIDAYYSKQSSSVSSDVHLTAAAAISLASKFDNVNYIRLKVLQETICQEKFSKEELTDREIEVAAASCFSLARPTPIDLLASTLALLPLDSEQKVFVRKSATMILRMSLFSKEIEREFSQAELSALSVVLALKIMDQIKSDPKVSAMITWITHRFDFKSGLFFPKLQALHHFTVQFESVVPQATSLRRFNTFAKCN